MVSTASDCPFLLQIQVDIPPVDGIHAFIADAISPGKVDVASAAHTVRAHRKQELQYLFTKNSEAAMSGEVVHKCSFLPFLHPRISVFYNILSCLSIAGHLSNSSSLEHKPDSLKLLLSLSTIWFT